MLTKRTMPLLFCAALALALCFVLPVSGARATSTTPEAEWYFGTDTAHTTTGTLVEAFNAAYMTDQELSDLNQINIKLIKSGDKVIMTSATLELKEKTYIGNTIFATLDLNGCTINRGLGTATEPVTNGCVIHNLANLTITNTDRNGAPATVGTITGGCAILGGGICNEGMLTIKGGSITDNHANDGGGIWNAGTLYIEGGSITGNGAFNGGVYNDTNAKLTMSGGSITGNTASIGGGINNSGTLTLKGGNITGNTVLGDGGGIWSKGTLSVEGGNITGNRAKRGGGIWNAGTLNIEDGSITGNTANTHGGGVYVENNSIFNLSGGVIGGDNAADKNTAAYGGGVYNYGTFNVSGNASVIGNKITGTETASNVFLPNEKTITVTDALTGTSPQFGVTTVPEPTSDAPVTVAKKHYSYYGEIDAKNFAADNNPDYDVTNATVNGDDVVRLIVAPEAEWYFGAETRTNETLYKGSLDEAFAAANTFLYEEKVCRIKLLGSVDTTDTLSLKPQPYPSPVPGTPYSYYSPVVVLDLNGNSIDRKLAEATENGSVIINNANLTIIDTSASDETQQGKITGGNTTTNGGGINNVSLVDANGDPLLDEKNYPIKDAQGNPILAKLTIAGGSITGNTAKRNGGGVYNTGTLNIEGGYIKNNRSLYGGGAYNIVNATLTMKGGSIAGNEATGNGGGGGIFNAGTLKLISGVIGGDTDAEKNTANFGGGIHNIGTLVTDAADALHPVLIIGNSAVENGGGIYNTGGTTNNPVTLGANVIIQNNTAKHGGGVFNVRGTLTLSGCVIKNNKTQFAKPTDTLSNGGGVYNYQGTLNVTDGSIEGNTALVFGGGLYNGSSATLNITGGSITGNNANVGGGLYNDATLNISAGEVKGNTANNNGGGIHCQGVENFSGSPIVQNNTISATGALSNLSLISGKTISVTKALTDGALIGITSQTIPTSNSPVMVVANNQDVASPSRYFTSDNPAYYTSNAYSPNAVHLILKEAEWYFGSETVRHAGLLTEAFAAANGADQATYITLFADVKIKASLTLNEGKTATLDLNGKTIDRALTAAAEKGSVIKNNGNLTVTDTSADAATNPGAITGGYAAEKGGGIWNLGTLTLAGGEITGNRAVLYGGGVYVDYMAQAVLTMTGGAVRGNTATGGSDGVTFGGGAGGGIYAGMGTTFELSGGSITGNQASSGGGVDSSGTFAMTNGSITGNRAMNYTDTLNNLITACGGGISQNGTMTMTGGSVTGNTSEDRAGGIFYTCPYGIVRAMNVSGNAVVKDNTAGQSPSNLYLNNLGYVVNPSFITIDGALGDGAEIRITLPTAPTAGNGVTVAKSKTGSVTAADMAKIHSDEGFIKTMNSAGGVDFIVSPEAEWTYIGTSIPIMKGTLANAFAAANSAENIAYVHIKLLADANTDTALTLDNGKTATLDLSGKTINRGLTEGIAGGHVIVNNGNLTVTDTSGAPGAITGGYAAEGGDSADGKGGGIQNNGMLTLAGGRVTANRAELGGGVFNKGTFVMTGGEIAGNTATDGAGVSNWNRCNMSMTGGKIAGNTATESGGGLMTYGGTVTLAGGEITGNTADMAGGVYFNFGDIVLSGKVKITDNTDTQGRPNAFVTDGKQFTVAGALSEDSIIKFTLFRAPTSGAPVVVAAPGENVTVVDKSKFVCENGYVMRVNARGELECIATPEAEWVIGAKTTQGALTEAFEAANGATEATRIKLLTGVNTDAALTLNNGKTATLDLNGKTINRGLTEATDDGCVIVNTGDLTIVDTGTGSKGAITGGFSRNMAGGVVNNGALTLAGGFIVGNTGDWGGGVYNGNGATLTVTGGEIQDNIAKAGGGVFNAGTLSVAGGEIYGNAATENGGGVYATGKVSLSGGKITLNEAASGGGVYFTFDAALEVSGAATVSGNTDTADKPNNVFLGSQRVTVTGALTGEIHVTTEETPAKGAPVMVAARKDASVPAINPALFVSDAGYPARLNQDGNVEFFISEYAITLAPATLDFGAARVGYAAQTAQTVTVTNAGNQATGKLTISLDKTDYYTLSATELDSIGAGKTTAFTVVPKDGLKEGEYAAAVTVSSVAGAQHPVAAQTVAAAFAVGRALIDPDPSENNIAGIKTEYTLGDTVSFTAHGGGESNKTPVEGDKCYTPGSWTCNPAGDFKSGAAQSFPTTGMTLGAHTLTVTFIKQIYNGTAWVNIAPEVTDKKSVGFTINAVPIDIEEEPEDEYIVEGQAATFRVKATGDGLTYQWFINRNDARGWQAIPGATQASYTTASVTLANNGYQYYCRITDKDGHVTFSETAILHVALKPVPPITGDNSNPALLIAVCALALLGAAVIVGRKKRA